LKLPKNYILFWACQSVSQFGSAMTGYALILWAYGAEKSAMSVSLLSLFSYLPYLFAGPLAGMISGRWKSRTVLLAADAAAEACTAAVLLLFAFGRLRVPMLYPVNFIESFMNAVQSPVANAAAGSLVPKEKFEKIGGMNSFSGSLISIAAPVFATSLLSLWGPLGGSAVRRRVLPCGLLCTDVCRKASGADRRAGGRLPFFRRGFSVSS
jgi:MFS family permease